MLYVAIGILIIFLTFSATILFLVFKNIKNGNTNLKMEVFKLFKLDINFNWENSNKKNSSK